MFGPKSPARRYARLLLRAVGFLTLASIALFAIAVPYLGTWLQPSDNPQKSDFIVVLAGGAAKCVKAARVYRQGYAPIVLVSQEYITPPTETEKIEAEVGYPEPDPNVLCQKILEHLGVPASAVRPMGKGNISTTDEAYALKSTAGDHIRAIIVSAPFQSRRAKIIFGSVLPGATFFVVSPTERRLEARWWHDKQSAVDASTELLKIAYFWFGGAFRAPAQ